MARAALAGLAGLALALALVGMSGLATPDAVARSASPAPERTASTAAPVLTASDVPTPDPEPPSVEFTLVAAGDVLPHSPVNASAATGDGYDYTPLMAGVRDYIAGADLALCHMEVPVAPDQGRITSYPVFGAPVQLVRDLARTGWDGCSTASNHSVDRGFDGVVATIDAFEAQGLGYAGTARTADEAASVQTYEVGEAGAQVTVAHISYAYGTNGLPVSEPYSVNLFDANAADASPIIEAAQEARDQGADVVIASTHCCVEYRTLPTAAQESIAKQIAQSGVVDLYIGHHAHVPQPIVKLDGGPGGDGMWVAYGLGNFLSNQSSSCCVPETSNGVLLTATFAVSPAGDVDVGVEWTATTVDRSGGHAVYALSGTDGGLGTLSAAEVQARHARVVAAVGTEAPERSTPAEHLATYMYRVDRSGA